MPIEIQTRNLQQITLDLKSWNWQKKEELKLFKLSIRGTNWKRREKESWMT